jgi:hypothetical protein
MKGRDIVHVLSLGAGVQSTTMLLMAAYGEIEPKPDFVIFADTGWEPKKVYQHLEWLKSEVDRFGIEIITTNNGNIRDDILKAVNGERFASLPFFVISEVPIYEGEEDINPNQLTMFDLDILLDDFDKETNVKRIIRWEVRRGMVRRQCTNEYKLKCIKKKIRDLLEYEPFQRIKEKVIMWKGISTDEIQRMDSSRDKWIEFRYPLIEKNMSRLDCLKWMQDKGYPLPPKSSCIGCPFHNDRMWLDMKMNDPESWNDAIEIDRAIRHLPRFKGQAFLHSSLKPLEEVDFGESQLELDLFTNECYGVCGV